MSNINKMLLLGLSLILLGVGGKKAVYEGKILVAKLWGNTRGLKNNNAGNIVHSDIKWKGLAPVQNDPTFVTFSTPEAGISAIYKNLLSYRRNGLDTIDKIIRTWSKTDQAAYVKNVSNALKINPNSKVPLDAYPLLVKAIIVQENGLNPYPDSLIIGAIQNG